VHGRWYGQACSPLKVLIKRFHVVLGRNRNRVSDPLAHRGDWKLAG